MKDSLGKCGNKIVFSDTLNKGFVLGDMHNGCNKNYQINDLWSFKIKEIDMKLKRKFVKRFVMCGLKRSV